MSKRLDENGVLYLWNKIKAIFVAKQEGKGLSTNDYTTEEKNKLAGIEKNANAYVHPEYTAAASGLYKVTVDAKGHVSETAAVTKADITNLGIPGQDTNTTYSAFKGATASAAGGSGLVPTPEAGAQAKFLKADGTWQTPPNTTYSAATQSANGLMTSADKKKLDGFSEAAAYALKTDLTSVYKYKGSVENADSLPKTGQTSGDVYDIQTESVYGPKGQNVAWNGTEWDPLGGIFVMEPITNAELDTICV